MAFLLFLFWVMCNGRLTVEIAIFGVVLTAALCAFLAFFLDYKPRYDWLIFINLPTMMQYILILIREIALANITMAGFIFTAKVKPEPVLVSFRTPLKSNLCQVLLANSITLTPGTITLKLENGEYQVHCYDRSMAVGLDDSPFVRVLQKLEENMK